MKRIVTLLLAATFIAPININTLAEENAGGQTMLETFEAPVDPEEPTDPIDPEEPTDPINPEEPTNPIEPEGPPIPEEPLLPKEPVKPEEPSVSPTPEHDFVENEGIIVVRGYSSNAKLPNTGNSIIETLTVATLSILAGITMVVVKRKKKKALKTEVEEC
ncbi:MAG: LPXTG cell wall anchor domain-containing protein [Culicoidibacterales bacterium]